MKFISALINFLLAFQGFKESHPPFPPAQRGFLLKSHLEGLPISSENLAKDPLSLTCLYAQFWGEEREHKPGIYISTWRSKEIVTLEDVAVKVLSSPHTPWSCEGLRTGQVQQSALAHPICSGWGILKPQWATGSDHLSRWLMVRRLRQDKSQVFWFPVWCFSLLTLSSLQWGNNGKHCVRVLWRN